MKFSGAACVKCHAGTLNSYVVAHRQVALCTNCYNRWTKLRNKTVGEAFENFIKQAKTK